MGEPLDVYLDLDENGGYHNCINDLRMKLANHPQHEQNIAVHGEWIRHHPLLPKQEAEQPNRWMHVHLKVLRDNEAKKTTLAVRDDNVWLVGFRNQSSRWFEFGISDLRNEHLISGSTFLGCDGSYGSLLEGRNIVDVNLGNMRAADAVCNLSSYNEDGTAGTETKRNLVCLIVMISESTRMFPHYIRVTDHWLGGATLCILLVDYLHNWGKMSSAMIGRAAFCKTLRAFGVSNLQGGLRVVRLLLNKPRDRRSSSAGQSRDRRGGGGGEGGDDLGHSPDLRQRGEGNQKRKQKQKEKKSAKGEAAVGKTKLKQQDEEEPPMTSAEQGLPQHEDEEEPLPMPTEEGPALMYHSGEEEDEEEGEQYEDDDYDNDDDDDGGGYDDDDDYDNDDDGGGDDDDDDQGRLLVEVFSVSASSCVVGRISVFDGRRGQIIYNHDGQGDALIDSQGNLTLTGPYKAISAGGRVAIKVTDASDNVYHTMLWDGYDDDAVYGEARTQSITTGTDQKAVVTYAVVSKAVEATVQVQLKLNRVATETIRFHGQITADMKDFGSGSNSVLLFRRNETEKVEVLCSPDGFIVPIPLARSVFVAPLYSSLGINVKLHAACPPSHEIMILEENLVFSRLQQHTITKEIEGAGVAVQVTITSDDMIQPPQEQINTTPPDSGGPTIEVRRVGRPGSPTAEQGTSPAQRSAGAMSSSSIIIHHPDKPQSLSPPGPHAAPPTSSPLQPTVWDTDSPPHKKGCAYLSMAIHREELRIELSDLRRITNNFSDAQKIGCGAYGDVYKADYNGEEIAVKLLDATKGIDDQQFMKELYNHMEVKHPNIVRLVGYCNEEIKKYVEQKVGPPVFGKHIYKVLCFEYMQGGSLDKRLSENSLGDDWCTHYNIIKETCEGLHYLHNGLEHRILHLDLKPGNILLDDRMEPKIADFGLSRIYTASRSNIIVESASGTTKYMPPELIRGNEISEKTDTYGLGVTIIDVIRGSVGFELYHELEATRFVENVRTYWGQRDGTAHLDQVEECTKIAIRCVDHDRRNRPTINEIVADLNATETQILAEGPRALTISSSRGKLNSLHVPDKLSSSTSGRGPLDVVIVYAFDCYLHTPAWYTMNDWVFWLVQEKLTHFDDSCLGYVMLTPKECISGMKLVDSADTKASGYTDYDRRSTKRKNMASGLEEAHNIISNRGHHNSIILFFSDGLVNKEYFFLNENFISQVPIHTFTLGGNAYNHILHSIAANSPGGKFHSTPIPERPNVSTAFSRLLDKLLGDPSKDDGKPPSTFSGRGPLDVVIVFAFDRTNSTAQTRYTVAHGVFWLLQEKLTRFVDSCLGYIYAMSTPNTYTYTSDMKLVDSDEKKDALYTVFNERTSTCTKNMASGLAEAHNMIKNRGHHNGIIFLFSDGLINKGDFFDGTDNYVSEVPVHTFTLGGDAYNHGLQAISANSPGGTFNSIPVPERPLQSEPFSTLLDGLLSRTIKD